METQNITLSLPKKLLKKVKLLAVERETSVSALLVKTLEDLVTGDRSYQTAMKRHLRMLQEPFDLGTQGHATWTRDELHER